jgi:hypothetical protein
MGNDRKRKIAAAVGLILILATASILRLSYLGARPLYDDEPYHTVVPACQPLSVILSHNLGSILYPAILHFILHLGPLEFMSRLPSAVFGILSVAMVYLLAGLVFRRRREAVIAAVFSAFSGVLIYYSQEARGYSGMLFFSLLALYFFLLAVRKDRTVFWAGYALSLVVGVYMHFFMLILLPVHALYIGYLAAWHWKKKRRIQTDHPALRLFFRFGIAVGGALLVIVLLYLPTRNPQVGEVSFFHAIQSVVTGFLKGEVELPMLSYSKNVILRLLDYNAWPLLFFLKILLLIIGLAAGLKNKMREIVLFILYLTVPFVLFVHSNPASNFQTIQTNKFIFLLPIAFLLIARGLGTVDSLIEARPVSMRMVLRGLLVSAVLVGEILLVREFRFTIWEMRSFPRNGALVDYMKDRVEDEEVVLSDAAISQLAYVFAKPMHLPRTGRPSLAFFEAGNLYFMWNYPRPMKLWMVLETVSLDEADARRLRDISSEISVMRFPPFTLISYPDMDQPLEAKISRLMEFLKSLEIGDAKRLEIDLFLARSALITGKNEEALAILDSLNGAGLKKRLPTRRVDAMLQKLGYARLNAHAHILENLSDGIDTFLFYNAAVAIRQDAARDAQALLGRIGDGNRRDSSFQLHVLAAESDALLLEGRSDEAEQKLSQAYSLAETPQEEVELVQRIARIRNMDSGFFIRQDGRWCRIYWWSRERGRFSGLIRSSRRIGRVREFRIREVDGFSKAGRHLGFHGISRNSWVKGLILDTRRPARLEIQLRIEGVRSPQDFVILIPDRKNPEGLNIIDRSP